MVLDLEYFVKYMKHEQLYNEAILRDAIDDLDVVSYFEARKGLLDQR